MTNSVLVKFQKLLSFIIVVLLGLAILLSYIYRIKPLTGHQINIGFMILLTIVAFLIVLSLTALYHKLSARLSSWQNLLLIVFLILIPRLFWIFIMPTKPVSDYGCFYSYAQKASQGFLKGYDMTFTLFRFRFGYSLILAAIFKIFGPTVLVGKIFNVFLSTILGIIIFFLVRYVFDEKSAMLLTFVYAFWPAQIMYNSVLASEHPFIVFFLLGIYFIIKALKEKKSVYAILGGLSIAISNHIRPVAIIVIVAFIVYIAFYFSKTNFKLATLSLLSYLATFYTIGYIIFCLTNIPVWQTSMGLNLMIGTDYTTYGMNNIKHSIFAAKYNYDFYKLHSDAMKIGINRIEHETGKFINILPRKHAIIWGDDSFGYFWSTFKVYYNNKFVKFIKSHPSIFYLISQAYYYAILIFIAIGILVCSKKKNTFLIFLNIIFMGYVVAHVFLEVQPRYHYPGIFTLFLLSGEGIKYCLGKFLPKKKKQSNF